MMVVISSYVSSFITANIKDYKGTYWIRYLPRDDDLKFTV